VKAASLRRFTGLVFRLGRVFQNVVLGVKCKLQLWFLEFYSQVKSIVAVANLEDESTELSKTFYLISFLLFVSLFFLAPDKIPQAFTLTQANSGILEKAQEIIKKAVPFIG